MTKIENLNKYMKTAKKYYLILEKYLIALFELP